MARMKSILSEEDLMELVKTVRQKWEYRWEIASENIDSVLEQMGDDGWELVAVTMDNGSISATLYFKRPK